MKAIDQIKFVPNNQIDRQKWNECIQLAPHGLIYAQSYYLDHMAAGWNALIGPGYSWVFPLTNKKKFGISYLYQPPFTQQLGVFSKPGVIVPFKEILLNVQERYHFWEINLNYATPPFFDTSAATIDTGNNFILNLSADYKSIAANYHIILKKNLKRSKRFKPSYRVCNDFLTSIELYKEHYGERFSHVTKNDYENFYNLCAEVKEKGGIVCREVVNAESQLMASALLLFDGKRLYNIMNTTTELGRKTEANHFLLNAVIEEFSGNNILLDFEGSDLPGVKSFYLNFGVVNQPYFKVRYNNLPWPIKYVKR